MKDLALHWTDVNHCDSWRIALAGSEHAEVREFGGVTVTHCGLRVRQFNLAFVTQPLADAHATLAAIDAYYTERELPYSVCIREGLDPEGERVARERGLACARTTPAMTLAPIPAPPPPPPPLRIERVEDVQELADFQRVSGASFGLPLPVAERFLGPRFLRHPAVSVFVGRVAGEAVAAAALVCTGRVAGVYWVGTLEEQRGRGFGEALTWSVCAEGVRRGCELASLQASELGRPVYERMGFANAPPYLHYQPPRVK